MFFEVSGEMFHVVLKTDNGVWAVSYDAPAAPRYLTRTQFDGYQKVPAPLGKFSCGDIYSLTEAQQRRLALISPLMDDSTCIIDTAARKAATARIATENHTTERRILRLYYFALAGRPLCGKRIQPMENRANDKFSVYKWAIDEFYFSAKKFSLRTSYDMMLLRRYTTEDGRLADDAPSWSSFRHYFYDNGFHRQARKCIAREGLSNYQRNKRILPGSAMTWRDRIGTYQMDATEADIYLVSRFDRSAVIGRPYVYLAVDTATQLIAGVYVGLEAGERAVTACLANAASDKVEYCRSLGIAISAQQWPCTGLPGEIVTDRGKEFLGKRVDELCVNFGMEALALPPFRPEQKGLVEKAFHLIQEQYKPLLRGKGIIEADAQERWAVDYRSQASLDLTEFTRVVVHCIIYHNSKRILKNFKLTAEMASDGVRPVAAELWRWYEKMSRSNIISLHEEEIYQMALQRTQTHLTRRGVTCDGLYYIASDYIQLIQKYGKKEVTVAYDPDNINYIYLLEDGQYQRLPLAPSCTQYSGLCAAEYRLLRENDRTAKKRMQAEETAGRMALLQNIAEIAGSVDSCAKKRQRGADIKNDRNEERSRRS